MAPSLHVDDNLLEEVEVLRVDYRQVVEVGKELARDPATHGLRTNDVGKHPEPRLLAGGQVNLVVLDFELVRPDPNVGLEHAHSPPSSALDLTAVDDGAGRELHPLARAKDLPHLLALDVAIDVGEEDVGTHFLTRLHSELLHQFVTLEGQPLGVL